MLVGDGSISVVRQDEDASNSGLLELEPMFIGVGGRQAMPANALHTPVLGQEEYTRAQAPPPLSRAPRTRQGDAARPPRRRSSGSTGQDASDDSNNSVIVHQTKPHTPWEGASHSPEVSGSVMNGTTAAPDDTGAGAVSEGHAPTARLRRWMHDAMKQHLYETAIFWGRQIVALERTWKRVLRASADYTATETAFNDAYWLAQAFFLTHQYARAEQLLTEPLQYGANADVPPEPAEEGDTEQKHVAGEALHAALEATRAKSILPSSIAGGTAKAADALHTRTTDEEDDVQVDSLLGEETAPKAEPRPTQMRRTSRRRKREPSESPEPEAQAEDGPTPFLRVDKEVQRLRRATDAGARSGPCLVNWSSPCRYLAAQCQVRLGKLYEALELIGEDHTRWTGGAGRSSFRMPALDGGLKLGSSVCHLRGQIYLRLDEVAKAKEAFMLALALDVKNYDSFSALIDGNLLRNDEQWSFVQSLEFAAQAGDSVEAQDDYEWVRLMYTTRLAKHTALAAQRTARARQLLCSRHPSQQQQPDVLLSLAEELFARLHYEDAYAVTSLIREKDRGYTLSLPIHIACMFYLPHLRPALFLLAHQLTEEDPESCEAWYAVGVWYASTSRWAEARRHFSKASLLDPRFAPSWIAFGHSFALEGESDQAITAYSTASRKFPYSALPRLFIGMEHLHQGNRNLASLFLESTAEELANDPLSANERGVTAFQAGDVPRAVDLFRAAIAAAAETQQPASAWVHVHLNLGLALRRLQRDEEARSSLLRVIEYDPSCATAYVALGMCSHRSGNLGDAIAWYHEGLGIDPRDSIATELLTMALDTRASQGIPSTLLSERDIEGLDDPVVLDSDGSLEAGSEGTTSMQEASTSPAA